MNRVADEPSDPAQPADPDPASAGAPLGPARAEAETRAWVRLAVIDLGFCPFAAAAESRGLVRYVVSAASDVETLLADLIDEMRALADTEPSTVETTLLIHPLVLGDFDDYNDFLDVADAALDELDLTGTLQIASFHPDYRFADTDVDDVTNATNRAPYPTLQLLREASIERAIDDGCDTDAVIDANLQTLDRIGDAGWQAIRTACRRAAAATHAAEPTVGDTRARSGPMPGIEPPTPGDSH